jgi:hypothetical protein
MPEVPYEADAPEAPVRQVQERPSNLYQTRLGDVGRCGRIY